MSLPERMKFGIFLAPFHWLGDNPTVCIERDLELLQLLDGLDFDEAWTVAYPGGSFGDGAGEPRRLLCNLAGA